MLHVLVALFVFICLYLDNIKVVQFKHFQPCTQKLPAKDATAFYEGELQDWNYLRSRCRGGSYDFYPLRATS